MLNIIAIFAGILPFAGIFLHCYYTKDHRQIIMKVKLTFAYQCYVIDD